MEESLPDLEELLGLDNREKSKDSKSEEIALPELFFDEPSEADENKVIEEDEEEIIFDWDEEDSQDSSELTNSRISSFGSDLPPDFDDEDEWNFEEDDEEEASEEEVNNGNHFYYPDIPERLDEDEDEEELIIPPSNKEEKGKKEKSSSSSLKDRFSKKFQSFKEQAAAELKGEDAPKEKPPGKELALVDDKNDELVEANEDEEEDKEKKNKKKSKGTNPFKKIFSPFWKLYLSLVKIIFNIINGTLGFLAKIPILGIPFKFIKQFTKPLEIIATSLPLILVLGILVYLNITAVDKETVSSLPDNGSVVFTDFQIDKETQIVSGAITNTGETIAVVMPKFTVYSLSPGLNPISWFMPQETQKCEAKMTKIDIEKTIKVQAKCSEEFTGIQIRVSGVAE